MQRNWIIRLFCVVTPFSELSLHFPNSVSTGGPVCGELSLGSCNYQYIFLKCLRRECVEVYVYCTEINCNIYFIVEIRQCVLHQFQAVSLEGCPSVPTVISPLKTNGHFMYIKMYTSTKYKYCITAYLCVLFDSQNQEKIFPYIAIAVPSLY
jgi:hypothetical protein